MKKLEIAFAKTAAEAEKFMCQGYCPVECSYGGVSIVDNLDMDHHGVTADGRDLSKLESVAIPRLSRLLRETLPRPAFCNQPY